MRVLIYGLNFWPEPTGVGRYTGELATWLAARGHQVRAVTTPPYYPWWRVSAGYSGWQYRSEVVEGVRVIRCPLWVPARATGFTRLLHLASFAVSSLPVILWQSFWRPDVVLVVEPTLLAAPQGWLAARLAGAAAWLHVQDFEVDAAFRLHLLTSRSLRRLAQALERWLMRRFDVVSTISERMLASLTAKGIAPERAVLFANWVDTGTIAPLSQPSPLRESEGIPSDAVVTLYAGNLGEKQGLEVLIEAARHLSHSARVVWVICGDGAARARLRRLADGLTNVRWLPVQPAERLNWLLNLADIHVLPQHGDAADLVMPSKLTGMLASGRPVVATAHAGTEIAAVVAGRGVVVPAGDAAALAEAVSRLAADPAERVRLGAAARRFAVASLDREAVLPRLEDCLVRVAKNGGSA